ncbi:MAG: SLATT domain-containing protein [Frankia sp.]|nr:SLATT domain-containing protein [Frankia sp.]
MTVAHGSAHDLEVSGAASPLARSLRPTPVPGRRGGRHAKDLRTDPLPVVSPQEWDDTEVVLTTLYRRAEKKAIDTVEWYLRRNRRQKRVARLLRALAVLLASVGLICPLVAIARSDSSLGDWGYVFLAAAAACVAFDRLFGFSTGWRRGVAGAQRVRDRLEIFQDDWTAACVPGAPNGGVAERLAILRIFTADLRALVELETAEWELEFHNDE